MFLDYTFSKAEELESKTGDNLFLREEFLNVMVESCHNSLQARQDSKALYSRAGSTLDTTSLAPTSIPRGAPRQRPSPMPRSGGRAFGPAEADMLQQSEPRAAHGTCREGICLARHCSGTADPTGAGDCARRVRAPRLRRGVVAAREQARAGSGPAEAPPRRRTGACANPNPERDHQRCIVAPLMIASARAPPAPRRLPTSGCGAAARPRCLNAALTQH